MRQAVRASLRAGADWIKLATTGASSPSTTSRSSPSSPSRRSRSRSSKRPAREVGGCARLRRRRARQRGAGRRALDRARRLPHRGAGGGDGKARVLARPDSRRHARRAPLGRDGSPDAAAVPRRSSPSGSTSANAVRIAKEYGVPLAIGNGLHQARAARQEPRGARAHAPGGTTRRRRRCSSRPPAAPSSAASPTGTGGSCRATSSTPSSSTRIPATCRLPSAGAVTRSVQGREGVGRRCRHPRLAGAMRVES